MSKVDELFDEADINHDGMVSRTEFRDFINRKSVVSNSGDFLMSNYADLNEMNQFESSTATATAARASFDNFNYSTLTSDGSASVLASATTSSTQQYETDAQGLFKDNNPQVIRKPATEGPLTYQQNIQVRFLQPPPVPPPGPLIIKEVRPPQPPPPPPLVVRQRAPTPPQPPPLVLRERPPTAPETVASQTIVRNLQAIPVPPRSVVIERIPAAPAKPRDIIIERWLPYPQGEKRKTIVQRAEAATEYPKPRNVIIEYELPQVRVVRQFERLNVTPENPEAYMQRYGDALLDTQALLQQARAAGVVEDLTPPVINNIVSVSRESISTSSPNFNFDTVGVSKNNTSATTRVSSYYGNTSSFESSFNNREQADVAQRLFSAADTNKDGVLSPTEFRNVGFY